MNETNINTELLAAESSGRKHIPLAVFAVIVIHVALFLVLLIAAGCRAKARAKQDASDAAVAAAQAPEAASEAVHPELMPAGVELASAGANEVQQPISRAEEPAMATEPAIERERASAPGPQRAPQRALASRPRAESSPAAARNVSGAGRRAGEPRIYVVQPGDTVGKIAKEQGVTIQSIRTENKLKKDLIYPGQKLRLSPKQTPRQMAAI
jgi:hypothetical protein